MSLDLVITPAPHHFGRIKKANTITVITPNKGGVIFYRKAAGDADAELV
jgi:hypothetical protein